VMNGRLPAAYPQSGGSVRLTAQEGAALVMSAAAVGRQRKLAVPKEYPVWSRMMRPFMGSDGETAVSLFNRRNVHFTFGLTCAACGRAVAANRWRSNVLYQCGKAICRRCR